MIRGIEDFLEGPEVLHDGGAAALAAIRAERAELRRNGRTPGGRRSANSPTSSRDSCRAATSRARTGSTSCWPSGRCSSGSGAPSPDRSPSPPRTTSGGTSRLFDHAVVTDASQSGVRIRRRDKQKLTTLTKRMTQGAATVPRGSACAAGQLPRGAARADQPRELGAALRQLISAGARRPVRCCPYTPDTRRCVPFAR